MGASPGNFCVLFLFLALSDRYGKSFKTGEMSPEELSFGNFTGNMERELIHMYIHMIICIQRGKASHYINGPWLARTTSWTVFFPNDQVGRQIPGFPLDFPSQ